MDLIQLKKNTFLLLVVLLFVSGLVIGYISHRPENVVKTEYINNTVENIVYKDRLIEVTPTPISTQVVATPTGKSVISNFTVRTFDPSTDSSITTIELTNRRISPETISIRQGTSVAIKINDYSLQSPITLIIDDYEKNLGRSGAVHITFSNKGIYKLKAIMPSEDPNILPTTYAEGTITVYNIE